MSINNSGKNIKHVYIGDKQVHYLYYGDKLIYINFDYQSIENANVVVLLQGNQNISYIIDSLNNIEEINIVSSPTYFLNPIMRNVNSVILDDTIIGLILNVSVNNSNKGDNIYTINSCVGVINTQINNCSSDILETLNTLSVMFNCDIKVCNGYVLDEYNLLLNTQINDCDLNNQSFVSYKEIMNILNTQINNADCFTNSLTTSSLVSDSVDLIGVYNIDISYINNTSLFITNNLITSGLTDMEITLQAYENPSFDKSLINQLDTMLVSNIDKLFIV